MVHEGVYSDAPKYLVCVSGLFFFFLLFSKSGDVLQIDFVFRGGAGYIRKRQLQMEGKRERNM